LKAKPPDRVTDVAAMKAALRVYHREHRTIPALGRLAQLWGYASKSSASRIVRQMVATGFLATAPGRRLRPGPAFDAADPADGQLDDDADPIDLAVERWTHGYPEEPSRAYDLTVRVLRIARSIEAGMARAAAQHGLSVGELLVLDSLYRLGPSQVIAPTALRRHFLLSLAGLGKRVDRLEERGLIDRVPDAKDGRSILIRLNDRGRDVLRRCVEDDRAEPHISWAISLPAAQRAALHDILKQAQKHIDRADGPPAKEAP